HAASCPLSPLATASFGHHLRRRRDRMHPVRCRPSQMLLSFTTFHHQPPPRQALERGPGGEVRSFFTNSRAPVVFSPAALPFTLHSSLLFTSLHAAASGTLGITISSCRPTTVSAPVIAIACVIRAI